MNGKRWTAKELAALKDSTRSVEDLAKDLGRTIEAVYTMRSKLGCTPKVTTAGRDLSTDRTAVSNSHWQQQYRALEKKYLATLKEQTLVDRLVDMAESLAPVSYHVTPPLFKKVPPSGNPESAVLLLSDTHIGQVVEPDQTLEFGGYNFQIFMARLKFLEKSVASICQNHTTFHTPEIVLCLGGDMIDGALVHSAEVSQQNTLFTQFYAGGHVLAQFIRNISVLAPKIRVYCTVGNHPRWANQHRMPTKNRYSNLDSFLYAFVQALTRDIPSVEWTLNKQPVQRFSVNNFVFQLMHGDTLRGGDKALGVPNHAVGRMLSSVSQQCGKLKTVSPHYYLVCHMHREIVLPHAKGSVIVNGGFPGLDGYALANEFTAVDPSQVMFFVHPKFGKTATYTLGLQHAQVAATPPYVVPTEFPVI